MGTPDTSHLTPLYKQSESQKKTKQPVFFSGKQENQAPGHRISIVSINIESLKSNASYIHELLLLHPKAIFCLQELWLYRFQQQEASQLFPNMILSLKCIDDPRTNTTFPHTLWHCRSGANVASENRPAHNSY